MLSEAETEPDSDDSVNGDLEGKESDCSSEECENEHSSNE